MDGVQRPLMVRPPARLVEAYGELGLSADCRREEMVAESRNLVAVRDALLPKLVSGELRVQDAERFVGRVA
jgi:type I restriction enzyme S subunit